MKTNPLPRLRKICLALPDTVEKEAWQTPTFRARGRMFVMFTQDHHGDGRVAMWCKAPPGVQEIVVGADPKRFFVPAYVGPNGWIGMWLDGDVDWAEVADHVKEAHACADAKSQRSTSRKRAPARKTA